MLTYSLMHSFRTRPMALPGVDDDDEAGAHMPHLLHYSEASSYGSQVTEGKRNRVTKKLWKKNGEKCKKYRVEIYAVTRGGSDAVAAVVDVFSFFPLLDVFLWAFFWHKLCVCVCVCVRACVR